MKHKLLQLVYNIAIITEVIHAKNNKNKKRNVDKLPLSNHYRNLTELEKHFYSIGEMQPNLIDTHVIGYTIRGTPIIMFEVGAPRLRKQELPPVVRLTGGIRGNEAITMATLLEYLLWLTNEHGYKQNTILNNVVTQIIPLLNPNGYWITPPGFCIGQTGSENANGIDIADNFPDAENAGKTFENETIAWLQLEEARHAISAINFRAGLLGVVYPYEKARKSLSMQNTTTTRTPDDKLFTFLASNYAQTHKEMLADVECPQLNPDSIILKMKNGISNGAELAEISGSMSDFSYIMRGTYEISVYVDCCKFPPNNRVNSIVKPHIEAIANFTLQAQYHVVGLIRNADNKPINKAIITIHGRGAITKSNQQGYFSLLTAHPGSYILLIGHDNYMAKSTTFRLTHDKPSKYLEITLYRGNVYNQ